MITKDKIEEILKGKFKTEFIEVVDDSHLHAGHREAPEAGGSHFSITIVSGDFEDKPLIQRHRMIYQALSREMREGVHALAIKAATPNEYQ